MKFVVLNGSPKGENSVTLQYVHYIEKQMTDHSFTVLHIAQQIQKLERNESQWISVCETIQQADGVIWAFPLYVYMVHGNYKRFIELISERHIESLFCGKPTILLSTSINFFDHTALNYMEGITKDLGMRYYGAYSAEMKDLTIKAERKRLMTFANGFIHSMGRRNEKPLSSQPKIAMLTDMPSNDTAFHKVLEHFILQLPTKPDIFSLQSLDMKGSCVGCLKCGNKNECIYEGKDEVIELYRKLADYDILVYALEIKDRYFSARWKQFVDRRFFTTHQPLLVGKQLVYLVKGQLTQHENLRQIIRANAELDRCHLSGEVDFETFDEVTGQRIEDAVSKVLYEAEEQYMAPRTFLGKGGEKIFRDEIWSSLRFVFMADHRYYKANGYYDFPQKRWGPRVLNFFAPLLRSIPAVNRYLEKNMTTLMLTPYRYIKD